jgi:hypothetical protein
MDLLDYILDQHIKHKKILLGKYKEYILLHPKDLQKIAYEAGGYYFNRATIMGFEYFLSYDIKEGEPKLLVDF